MTNKIKYNTVLFRGMYSDCGGEIMYCFLKVAVIAIVIICIIGKYDIVVHLGKNNFLSIKIHDKKEQFSIYSCMEQGSSSEITVIDTAFSTITVKKAHLILAKSMCFLVLQYNYF